MIKVCEHCSRVDIKALKEVVGEENVTVTCLENCAAYDDKSYGYIDGELFVEDSSENWIKKVSEAK